MMADKTILDFQNLNSLEKKFQNEGEELADVTMRLRQAVHNLHKDWIGQGADSFFDEMEMVLLPAMKRLYESMFLSSGAVKDIEKIYRDAEDQCGHIFKQDINDVHLGSTDFGAGLFAGGAVGVSGSGINLGDTDCGAGQFGWATGEGS